MIFTIDFHQNILPLLPLNLLIRFVVIVVLALVFRGVIAQMLGKIFYVSFRKFADSSYLSKFKELLQKPIKSVISIIAFYIALNQINVFLESITIFKRHKISGDDVIPAVKTTSISLLELIDHLFFLVFIYYVVLLLSRLLYFIFHVYTSKAIINEDRERQQLMPLLRDVLNVIVWSFGFFTILGVVFHVNVPTLIAGLGFGGVALAFAAKESLENLLASFMIMLDKPFTLGDHIKLGDVEGVVEALGFRSTRIRTFDKTLVSMPNKNLISDSLENFTQRGLMRVKHTLEAVYGTAQTDLLNAMHAIKQHLIQNPNTADESRVFLEKFGAALEIHLSYFIIVPTEKSLDDIRQEIHLEIYRIMYKYAGGFAFPTNVQINGTDTNNVKLD